MANAFFKDYFISYFDKEEPVCREERQYALFLYNKLLNNVGKEWTDIDENNKKLLSNLKLAKIKLLSIAYEATFMRDLFERDRFERFKKWFENDLNDNHKYRETNPYIRAISNMYRNDRRFIECDNKDENAFNTILVKHFGKDEPKKYLENVNFGSHNKYVEWEAENTNCRIYVKIKPDLSVLYLDDENNLHLRFLECKYLSDESNDGKEPQTEVQRKVCQFICKELLGEKVIADQVHIVRFISKLNNNLISPDECNIKIRDIVPKCLIDDKLRSYLHEIMK